MADGVRVLHQTGDAGAADDRMAAIVAQVRAQEARARKEIARKGAAE